jgi:hypothetical protein
MTNKSRVYHLQPTEHKPEDGGAIRFGKAVLPFCTTSNCWLLPAGPNQQQRKVHDIAAALRFVRELHQLISRRAA